MRALLVLCLAMLAACGGVSPLPPSEYLSGGLAETGNGLVPADRTLALTDLEGETFKVRLARFVTDYETGETRVLISDEEVTAGSGYGLGNLASFALTIDGTPVVLTDDAGVLENGQVVRTYINTLGGDPASAMSGTVSVYSYAYGDDPERDSDFDFEAFHAFGYETSPKAIAAMSGEARFDGRFFGYGQMLDGEGSVVRQEVENNGNIAFSVNFASGLILGAAAGTIEKDETVFWEYDGTMPMTTIEGNGFGGHLELACPAGSACTSDSLIGGAFYGAGADEISGVMGFDETRDAERFIGAGGFSASQ